MTEDLGRQVRVNSCRPVVNAVWGARSLLGVSVASRDNNNKNNISHHNHSKSSDRSDLGRLASTQMTESLGQNTCLLPRRAASSVFPSRTFVESLDAK